MKEKTIELNEKVVLITGAARRLGSQVALRLHREGMRVVVHCHHSRDEAAALVDKLNAFRPQSACLQVCDLLDMDALQGLAESAMAHWGRLDVLVNNASLFYPTPIADVTENEWNRLLDIHTKVPFFLARALEAELVRQKGCIVNITDIHGDRPLKGYPVYSIAKAGLLALTKALARELGPEVRCNAVAPGAILWPEAEHYEDMHREIIARTALKREGHPDDIAKAIVYLIRDAGYVTGHTLIVDGGRTLSN